MGRTTVTIRDETHRQLEELKYETRSRSFDAAIRELIDKSDLDL